MGGMLGILRTVLLHRLFYYALAWAVVLLVAHICLWQAWHAFDEGRRHDGNGGHTTIDFGGQYLMGRMLLEGQGQHLYDRRFQRAVLREAYPCHDEIHEPRERIASCLLPLGAQDAVGAILILDWGQQEKKWDADELEKAAKHQSDVENLMYWLMGTDGPREPEVAGSALAPLGAGNELGACILQAAAQEKLAHFHDAWVGGPLYPPVNAFICAPLALLPPREAYHAYQVAEGLLTFVAGLAFSVISRRRFWWPVASLGVMLFPGFLGSINLGQNPILTLTILAWGWALIARDRPGWGGALWGLLAFKPVWAMVFFLVLVLTRRWRACLAMLGVGAALGLATLPFIGIHSWLDWLHVGKEAALLYNTDKNWIWLSRDLLSMPRRWWLDFRDGAVRQPDWYPPDPNGPGIWWHLLCGSRMIEGWLMPSVVGWALLAFVLEVTARVALLRKEQARAVTGPPAAFVLLGAWLCCYHFMYYDVLLAALPVFLLFTEPRRYLEPVCIVLVPMLGPALETALRGYHQPRPPRGMPPPAPLLRPAYANIWVVNRFFPSMVLLLLLTQPLFPWLQLGSYYGPPWDTFFLMLIWAWCGWLWLRTGPPAGEPARKVLVKKPAEVPLPLPL
jgi:hypothetical protein